MNQQDRFRSVPIDSQAKALVTSVAGSPQTHASSSVQRALEQRLTLSDAIQAATEIVDRYPNGGKNCGKSYIGALAATLADYPMQVAVKCAGLKGVTAECQFLPTVADVVAWCEKRTEPLRQQHERDRRVEQQFKDRAQFQNEQGDRNRRLSIDELKEKYGDWRDNWRSPGLKAQEIYDKARADLVSQIGEDEFDALPEAAE